MSKNGNGAVKSSGKINYIEPNDLPAFFKAKVPAGQAPDNIGWDPEDMNIFVDLQVVIPSRQYDPSSIKEYGDFNFNDAKYQSVLSGVKLNTEKGDGGNFLTTDWTNISYREIRNNHAGSKETLGINSINISFDSNMYPRVTMNFTDVRGSALMGVQEQAYVDKLNGVKDSEVTRSFFSSVFKFPYPRFLLSVKGIYGTCVTFVLSVEDFRGNFNSESGNFDVVIKFIGHMYGLYTDIPMNYLLVAPYIGSKNGGLTTNEYWNSQVGDGVFTYNENNQRGGPIMTFLEFYRKFSDMKTNGDFENALGEAGTQISNNSLDDANLTKILNLAENFWERGTILGGESSIGTAVTKGIFYSCEVNDKGYVFFEPSGTMLSMDSTFLKEFSKLVKDYKNVNEGGFFAKSKEYDPFSEFYAEEEVTYASLKLLPIVADITSGTFSIGDIRPSGINEETWKKISEKVGGGNLAKCKCYLIYDASFKQDIKAYTDKLKQENDDLMPSASQEVEDFVSTQFGFTFTIENVMRMLFAHFDTFMKCFYDTILSIDGSRTLESMGKFEKNNTDISSSSDLEAHVPPFTGFFDKNGKRLYPPDAAEKDSKFEPLKNIPEVELVENIFNGIGTMRDFGEEINNMGSSSEDSDKEGGDITYKFTAIMPGDIFYDGTNPYDTISTGNLSDVLAFFLSRLYLFYVSNNGSGKYLKLAAEVEAENFKKSNLFQRFRAEDFGGLKNEYYTKSDTIKNICENNNVYGVIDGIKYSSLTGSPLALRGLRDSFEKREKNSPFFLMDDYNVKRFEANSVSDKKLVGLNEDIYVSNTAIMPLFERDKVKKYDGERMLNAEDDDSEEAKMMPLVVKDKSIWKRFVSEKENNETNKAIKGVSAIIGLWLFLKTWKAVAGDKYAGKEKFYDAIAENNTDWLWVPEINWKDKNVLVEEKPAFSDAVNDPYFFALHVLRLLSGFGHNEEYYKKILKPEEDSIKLIAKIDYYIICGLCFMHAYKQTHDDDAYKAKKKDFEALFMFYESFDEDRISEICDSNKKTEFVSWVDSEFTPNFLNAIPKDAWKYATKKKTFLKDVPLYEENFERYLLDLYCEKQFLLLARSPFEGDSVSKSFSLSNSQCIAAIKEFLSIVRPPEDKEKGETENENGNESGYNDVEVEFNVDTTEDNKAACYYTLKNLYDRWLAMLSPEDFKLYSPEEEHELKKLKLTDSEHRLDGRSEFLNFVYVDSFYNDISKKFIVNPASIFELVGEHLDGDRNQNVWEFICAICQENKLLPRCLPVYCNIYKPSTFAEIFTPNQLFGGLNRTSRRIGNTYVLMYTYEPSHLLNIEEDRTEGVGYSNDSFDIADSAGDPTPMALSVMAKDIGRGEDNYEISAFGVTAAKQNQQYFTKISVGMDNPRVTDFSIKNMFQLADMAKRGGTVNTKGTGQDLYSIYSNRSYDCSVEMLGCANIMPMMYFQLNNVPMFKGAYMITKVEHNIQNNTMTTKFTGTRLPKRYVPFVSNAFIMNSLRASLTNYSREGGGGGYWSYGKAPEWNNGTPSGTLYIKNMEKQMDQSMPWEHSQDLYRDGKNLGKTGYKNPREKGSRSYCAGFIFYFLHAGFNGYSIIGSGGITGAEYQVRRRENGFSGCDGYLMREFLAANGFKIVARQNSINSFKPEPGDVCVMNYAPYGHVCMWSEKGYWISDFQQNDWGRYYGKIGPDPDDVVVYRFAGEVNNTDEFAYNSCIYKGKKPKNDCQPEKKWYGGGGGRINFTDFVVPEDKMDTFINALAGHESGNNSKAIGDNGAAVGILQMHPSAVVQYKQDTGSEEYKFYNGTEATLSMSTSGSSTSYFSQYVSKSKWDSVPQDVVNLDSRYSEAASKKMCKEILTKHVKSRSFVKMCDVWNTWSGHAPASYVNDVKMRYDNLLS